MRINSCRNFVRTVDVEITLLDRRLGVHALGAEQSETRHIHRGALRRITGRTVQEHLPPALALLGVVGRGLRPGPPT